MVHIPSPCPCGNTMIGVQHIPYTDSEYAAICPICHRRGPCARTSAEAISNWNAYVSDFIDLSAYELITPAEQVGDYPEGG